MAENREASLCLPAEFLTDDDILTGELKHIHQLPSEFPYDFADRNDFCTELTRRFALSTLLNSNNKLHYSSSPDSEKKWSLSGSPQSILSPVMSNGSPNLPFHGPSSPTAPFGLNHRSMDVISAAAGEANAWKMKNNISIKNAALLAPPFNFTPFESPNNSIPVKQNCGSIWAQSPRVTADYSCGYNVSVRGGSVNRPLECRLSNMPVHRQQCNVNSCVNGDGFVFPGGRRYVAAGGAGLRKKSAGTGVFLPRRYPDSIDCRVKSGCPSSFNTPKTAQELNVNYGNVMSQTKAQAPFMSGSIPDHDVMIMRRNAMLAQLKRNNMNMMPYGAMKGDMLPPEKWSY